MSAAAKVSVNTSGGRVIVNLTITNNSPASVLFLEKTKVFAVPRVQMKLFRITCDGKEIPYLGPMAKLEPPGPDGYFRLAPKGEFQNRVDISDLYGFLPGKHTYSIVYRAFHGDPTDKSKLTEIKSEPVEFEFEPQSGASPSAGQPTGQVARMHQDRT